MNYQYSIMRSAFNASLDGILVVDHQTMKVHDYNSRFLELWKIPPELAAEKSDEKLLHYVLNQLKEPNQFLQLVQDLYATPERKSFDTLEFKDGRFFDRYSEALIIDSKVCGRVWFFRDVTAQREAHRALLQSAKMSSLGEMASGIAHEINNPLTIIQNMAGLMSGRVEKGEASAQWLKENLLKIENTTQRIAKIIRGLRAFSRNSEADPMLVVKISQIMDETLELCQQKFQSEGIELRVQVDSNVSLKCRSPQISQVLMNLLSNSYAAIIQLPEKWIEVRTEFEKKSLILTVTDSGKGIPAEIRDRIMDPFFTTKETGSGTGLGLSISKGIVEEHQGQLYYDPSSPRTRFVLKFPSQQVY